MFMNTTEYFIIFYEAENIHEAISYLDIHVDHLHKENIFPHLNTAYARGYADIRTAKQQHFGLKLTLKYNFKYICVI